MMLTTRSIPLTSTVLKFDIPASARFVWMRRGMGHVTMIRRDLDIELDLVRGEWLPIPEKLDVVEMTDTISETVNMVFSDRPLIVGSRMPAEGPQPADQDMDPDLFGQPVLGGFLINNGDSTSRAKFFTSPDGESLQVVQAPDEGAGAMLTVGLPGDPDNTLDVRQYNLMRFSIYNGGDQAIPIVDQFGNNLIYYNLAGQAFLDPILPTTTGTYYVPLQGITEITFMGNDLALAPWDLQYSLSRETFTPSKQF